MFWTAEQTDRRSRTRFCWRCRPDFVLRCAILRIPTAMDTPPKGSPTFSRQRGSLNRSSSSSRRPSLLESKNMKIPLAKPEILESDIEAVTAVLRSSRLSQGPMLQGFEEAMANYLGVAYAVAVNSGTSALQLGLRALGIAEGDEVILPSFSFMAVTNAVL